MTANSKSPPPPPPPKKPEPRFLKEAKENPFRKKGSNND